MQDTTLLSVLSSWAWQPVILLGLALAAGSYAYGFYHFKQHGQLANLYRRELVKKKHPWLFGLGLATLFIALLSPIDVLSSFLFSFHMVQHILLIMVAPPLLLLGIPAPFLRWGLVKTGVRTVLEWFTNPLIAFLLYNLNLFLWHVPALYQAALENELVHSLEHATFFYTSLLFWWRVIDPTRTWFPLWQSSQAKWFYLIIAAPPSYILGSIFWASNEVIYPYYSYVPRLWQFSALADQQLGGVLMWAQGWMFFMLSMVIFFLWYDPKMEQV
jgi:putative membrane protein